MTETFIPLENEIWKPIIGTPYYEASNFGRVRSLDRPISYNGITKINKSKIKSLRINVNNYLVTDIYYRPYKKRTRTVHTLVMEAFIGPIPRGYVTDHKNGNTLDNHLRNLEYVLKRENDMRGKNACSTNHHISWNYKRKTYRVRIRVNGKRLYAESVNLLKAIAKRDKMLHDYGIIITGVKNADFVSVSNTMDDSIK